MLLRTPYSDIAFILDWRLIQHYVKAANMRNDGRTEQDLDTIELWKLNIKNSRFRRCMRSYLITVPLICMQLDLPF